jgi:tetratricopeptide (TPR) repeat protein
LTFGSAPGALSVGPVDSWESVCRRLPEDWRPDGVILALGRGSIPISMWSAPLPLIALAPDGWLHAHEYRHVLKRCDLVVTDAEGEERLRRLSISRLYVPSSWASDPPAPEVGPSNAPRDIDVLFVGDPHPAVQRQRLPWLGRLARFGKRWRVLIQSAVTGAEQEELPRRARIVFHWGQDTASIPRLRHAAAQGALLFLEAGALPFLPDLRDRQTCIRYTADNLETLLEHYLVHEDERQRLAEAARHTVRSPTAVRFWPELLGVLERDGPALVEQARRRPAWNLHDQLLARTWQMIGGTQRRDPTLAADLGAALDAAPEQVALWHALGLAMAAQPEEDSIAAGHFGRVLSAQPQHVLAGLNRAEALARAGRSAESIEQARQTLATLDGLADLDPAWLDAGHYPPNLDVFRVEWERALWQHAGDPDGECRAKRTLLLWRLHGLLARRTGDLAHRYEAALARPDLPATRATLGSALWKAHRPAEAVPHLRHALAANPFDVAAARLLHEALGALGRRSEQECLAHDRRLLHRAAPQTVPAESWFQQVLTLSPPTARPRVSLCMIVKDEEANLPTCLASVADLVGEIIVVDTGSRDATRVVAQRFGARVFDFAWTDSFAAARNESLRYATCDWIFYLDADDQLDEDNRSKLRALFASLTDDNAAYLMRQHSLPEAISGAALVVDQVKLFRNDPRIRWEYRVHEQILPAILRAGGSLRPTDIVFRHTGYQDPALRRRKLERNRRLLLLDQAERPDDPLTLFNLGSLHLDLGQVAEAVTFLRRSLERTPPGYSLLPRIYELLSWGLRRLGQTAEALAVCRQGRTRYPEDSGLLAGEAHLLLQAGEKEPAEACLRQLLASPPGPALSCTDLGLHGYKSRHHLAQLCREQGRLSEAEQHWRAAIEERPDFVPAWLSLADLYLAQGRTTEIEQAVARLGPGHRLIVAVVRARLQVARRDFGAARQLLEEMIAEVPSSLWPRLLLGQMLVRQGSDLPAAARVLREVLKLDPHQEQARQFLARLEPSLALRH